MAVGDHPESTLLLPGGSRVEGFDVSDISSSPATNRRKRTAVMFITAIAAVSCLATISVRGVTSDGPVEMVGAGSPKASESPADKLTSNLPSWLRTPDVKLMPLKNLVAEQQIVRAESEGKLSHKLAMEEHPKSAPSPRSLAMKNVGLQEKKSLLHTQAVAKAAVSHVAPKAVGSAEPKVEHAVKKTAPASNENVLKKKQEALKRLIEREHHKEAAIKKAELHKLALLKARDGKEAAKLEKQIKAMESGVHHQKLTNEKAALKAEMAQIEDEENEKLKALKGKMAKLDDIKKPNSAAAEPAVAAKPAADHPKATRSHAVVHKEPVKVHQTAESAAKPALSAKPKARETQLSWGDEKKKKKACSDNNCDEKAEDSKWLASHDAVDKFAEEAQSGGGKAKAMALAHMKELQEQIDNDYKHVTGFAVTQEHALPPIHQ
eukprot:CAMPEP_0181326994 /NCGR_PEP_ID=MMETSP1101-20121128/21831_1 /TAXON_ID=46948 /ORGANISM="Rhodomonas abbreviata, Strain Caron Lab Isolate" /LENGTH=434 /DNA_ID=CAMNT_0023435557 /DNA_START=26 /DNA_END=1330 /DNA_ORIENTATION=+